MELTSTKTSDSENDTPPPHPITQLPLIKPLSFSNREIKNHHHQQPPCTAVAYKECLKNHAASIGGHAVDGCGEFMPSSDATPTNPTSLLCAACGCHRNFHRREPADDTSLATGFSSHFIDFRRHILPPINRFSPSPSPSPPPQPQPVTPTALKAENPSGRKRFRTKFTTEQKEKMHSFSEKLGWKLQKCDESKVEEFCNEIGVGKGVLRVWMHNNKNKRSPIHELFRLQSEDGHDNNKSIFGKKDFQNAIISNNNNNNGGFNINGGTSSNNDDSNCGLHLHISTNNSSSSS